MYKINIHAHSYFSDGLNSPLAMAMKAKELDFTSLVITDHYEELLRQDPYTYKKAIQEAKMIIPVITGIEIPFEGQHILVFGGAAIKDIMANGPSVNPDPSTAYVLAHPRGVYSGYFDAYEKYNSGIKMTEHNAQAWCNSDAHTPGALELGYNLIDTKITVESELIRFINKQRPVKHYLKGD